MPKISVIIPIYNKIEFLERSITSVLNQSLTDIEIILVNDGSDDASLRFCRCFEEDNRVVIIDKKNGGQSSARNLGIEKAKGEYVAFLDADDYVDPQMYEKMYSKAKEYDTNLVICDYIRVTEKGNFKRTDKWLQGGYYDNEKFKTDFYPMLLMKPEMDLSVLSSNWLMIVKRDILIDNNIRYDEKVHISEDELFGCLCAYYSGNMYYLKDEYLYYYVDVEASLSKSSYFENWEQDYTSIIMKSIDTFMEFKDYDFSDQLALECLYFIFRAIASVKKEYRKLSVRKKKLDIIFESKAYSFFKNNFKGGRNIPSNSKIYVWLILHKLSGVLAVI